MTTPPAPSASPAPTLDDLLDSFAVAVAANAGHMVVGAPTPADAMAARAALLDAFDARARERDLAVAHDRQPYPTAEAYEKVCAARTKQQERAEAAESRALAAERDRDQWRHIGHLAEKAVEHARSQRDAASSALETMRARADGLEALLRRFAPDAASLVADVRAALASPSGTPRDVRVVRCGEDEARYDAEIWEGDVLVASVRVADDAEQIAGFLRRTPPVQYPAPDATPEDAP